MRKLISGILLIGIVVVIATQITIFVIQPIGAAPEGRTVVMLRMNKTTFIDSADAVCAREMGKVNILCRGAVLAAMAEKSTVLFRLPYSEFLYEVSTGGVHYSR